MNRSGLLRFEEEGKLPQTVERLRKLRKISKTFIEEVKAACASVSSNYSISEIVYCIVYEKLYF